MLTAKERRARPILLLGDPVARHHAAGHMRSVTWQWNNPGPDIVRMHIDDLGGRGKQLARGPRVNRSPARLDLRVVPLQFDLSLGWVGRALYI
jgi:hypothetical protein